MVTERLKELVKDFNLSDSQLQEIYRRFCRGIKSGLSEDTHDSADMKCLITYVQDLPSGDEIGKYLALDFGGSQFRVLCITLRGDSDTLIESETYPISKDLMENSGEELFDYIADCLSNFVQDYGLVSEHLSLGFTFSFPCMQLGLENALLVRWTKGFMCSGVENEDVGRLLKEAIIRRGGVRIHVAAILNDTTGTLMSCAHRNPNCRIGVIIGAGFNACYMERSQCVEILEDEFKNKSGIIINTEMGAFGNSGILDFIRTKYDRALDEDSVNAGYQIFEKMIAGLYLGEIVRRLLRDAVEKELIFANESNRIHIQDILNTANCIETSHLAEIERDDPKEMKYTTHFLQEIFEVANPSPEDCNRLKFCSEAVTRRAAILCSLGLSGLINKINEPDVVVGLDGSVYRFHPKFDAIMRETMRRYVHPKVNFDLVLSEDGSGRGAALVAAVSSKVSGRKSMKIDEAIKNAMKEFVLSDTQLREVYKLFCQELRNGLGKDTNSTADIKCWMTYLQDFPEGDEEGMFLALDLGTTNFRVVCVTLTGIGEVDLDSQIYPITKELKTGSGEKLFDYIADCLVNFVKDRDLSSEVLPLGFTFSFPCMQMGLDKATLVRWTKGFQCDGVENEDVGRLLKDAIEKRGEVQINLMAVINDTTGTLISCAFKNPDCRVGMIIGAGFNACYVERVENIELLSDEFKKKPEMIINCEWGAFGENGSLDFIRTEYDRAIDEQSPEKGSQIFEKMIGGLYLGNLVRLILRDAILKKIIFEAAGDTALIIEFLNSNVDCIQSIHVSEIEGDDPRDMTFTMQFLKEQLKMETVSMEDCLKVKYICGIVSKRAASFAAIAVSGLINKIDTPKVVVGADGSLYRYHPKFDHYMRETMRKFVDPNIQFDLTLAEDGSGRGAALVAAVTSLK